MKKPSNITLSLAARILILHFAFCIFHWPLRGQSTVQFYLVQFTGATNDTTINLQAKNNPVIYNGNYYWWPQSGTNLATTNGFAQINLIPGQYVLGIAGCPQNWTITVTNSAVPLNAAGLTTSTLIYSGINSLLGPGVTNDSHGNYVVTVNAVATNFATIVVTNDIVAGTISGFGSTVGIYSSDGGSVFLNDASDDGAYDTLTLANGINLSSQNAGITAVDAAGDTILMSAANGGFIMMSDVEGDSITLSNGVSITGVISGNGSGLANIPNTALSSNVVLGTNTTFSTGVYVSGTNSTTSVFVYGAGSNIVNGTYVTNAAAAGNFTNTANSVQIQSFSGYYYLTNSGVGAYYRLSANNLFNVATGWNTSGGSIGSSPSPRSTPATNFFNVTNYATAWLFNRVPATQGGNFERVSTFGDDAHGLRGDYYHPFATPAAAASNMLAGDAMLIDAGVYDAVNVSIPPGSSVMGSGSALTTVYINTTNTAVLSGGVGPTTFFFQNGGTIQGLSLWTTNEAMPQNYQIPFLANGKITFNDIQAYGDSDGLYNPNGTTVFTGNNSTFHSQWDTCHLGASGPMNYFYNCWFMATSGANGSLWTNGCARGIEQGPVTMFGGGIVISNAFSSIAAANCIQGPNSGTNYFFNVSFQAYSTNGQPAAIVDTTTCPSNIVIISGIQMNGTCANPIIAPVNNPYNGATIRYCTNSACGVYVWTN